MKWRKIVREVKVASEPKRWCWCASKKPASTLERVRLKLGRCRNGQFNAFSSSAAASLRHLPLFPRVRDIEMDPKRDDFLRQ